jgi:DNA-binding PadR family transcriptional regulator
MSFATLHVLQSIASGYVYGFDIMDATDLPSGTVYPILSKLEDSGFLKSRWEDARVAKREKRPPRKSYEITGAGREALEENLKKYRMLQRLAVRKATS